MAIEIKYDKDVKIENTTNFSLSHSVGTYINGNIIYKLDLENDKYILSFKDNMVPFEKRLIKEIDKEQVIELESILNKYKINQWNGFKEFDNTCLDGNDFGLNYRNADRQFIMAQGYMKYPENYSEFRNELDNYYKEIFKKELEKATKK